MLPNIVIHSLQVCLTATFLVDQLGGESGIKLDRDLVQASALLHDITKTRSLTTGEIHALTGAELIDAMGYPDVAYIIGHHVILDVTVVSDAPVEVEIVNYADKRVLHDRVVSLQERMDYILVRYAKHPGDRDRIARHWSRTKDLEKKVFVFLPFSPGDLGRLLGPDSLSAAMKDYNQYCGRFHHQPLSLSFSFDELPSTGVNSPG
jgi:uncharacterized protein